MALEHTLATGGTAGFPWGQNGSVRVDQVIDFKLNPLTAGGHAAMINVPAGSFVRVAYDVLRADTGASTRTFDLGDGADPDGYADGVDAKTTGKGSGHSTPLITPPATLAGTNVAFALGKYYPTAGVINLLAVQALTDGKIRVTALIDNINCG